MKAENPKSRKLIATVVMALIGVALIGLGYWIGLPIGDKTLGSTEANLRIKLSALANAFGFVSLIAVIWINMPPRKKPKSL